MIVGKGSESWFRKIADEDYIQLEASKTIDNILGLSDEQVSQQIIDAISGGTNKSFLEERVLKYSDKELAAAGFLKETLCAQLIWLLLSFLDSLKWKNT